MSNELISREDFAERAAKKTRGKPTYFAFGYNTLVDCWILFPHDKYKDAEKTSKEMSHGAGDYIYPGDVSIRTFPLELARHLYARKPGDIEVFVEELPITLDLETYIARYPEYCKSGVKANPQASPEDYSEKLKTLTAKQLSAEEKRQELFSSALNKKAIEEGYGNYRYSDMRAMQDPPAFIVQHLDVADKQRKIALEIEKRYAYSGTLKPIKGR